MSLLAQFTRIIYNDQHKKNLNWVFCVQSLSQFTPFTYPGGEIDANERAIGEALYHFVRLESRIEGDMSEDHRVAIAKATHHILVPCFYHMKDSIDLMRAYLESSEDPSVRQALDLRDNYYMLSLYSLLDESEDIINYVSQQYYIPPNKEFSRFSLDFLATPEY